LAVRHRWRTRHHRRERRSILPRHWRQRRGELALIMFIIPGHGWHVLSKRRLSTHLRWHSRHALQGHWWHVLRELRRKGKAMRPGEGGLAFRVHFPRHRGHREGEAAILLLLPRHWWHAIWMHRREGERALFVIVLPERWRRLGARVRFIFTLPSHRWGPTGWERAIFWIHLPRLGHVFGLPRHLRHAIRRHRKAALLLSPRHWWEGKRVIWPLHWRHMLGHRRRHLWEIIVGHWRKHASLH
jgi:hypothetical protein